jgi:hypothetical protein
MTLVNVVAAATLVTLPGALFGQTIVGVEVESYFYADGQMKRGAGQFENTYLVQKDKIIRTRVYDQAKKEVIPDDTEYRILSNLTSHPERLPQVDDQRGPGRLPAVIRAVGMPGSDAVEVLVIGPDFIQACKSTSDYFVVSRLKRIK